LVVNHSAEAMLRPFDTVCEQTKAFCSLSNRLGYIHLNCGADHAKRSPGTTAEGAEMQEKEAVKVVVVDDVADAAHALAMLLKLEPPAKRRLS
jgi:adenine/guanine phosphoribosyltransferase-like PRPP-binding protein